MDSLILAFIALVNVILLVVVIYALLKVKLVSAQVKSFITPVDDKTPSPLASLTQGVSEMFARSITASIKAQLMNGRSTQAKAIEALAGEAAEQGLAGSPIGAIVSQVPSLKRGLRKNPALLDLFLGMLNKSGNSLQSPSSPSNGQVKFKL